MQEIIHVIRSLKNKYNIINTDNKLYYYALI